jgi:Ca2+-binding RTX toxin-like protein
MNPRTARLLRRTKVVGPALGALALTLTVAQPASANPAYVTRQGSQILFAGVGTEQNSVSFTTVGGTLVVMDTISNLFAGPGCTQGPDIHTVTCGATAGLTRIRAALGAGDDQAVNGTSIPSDIDGGLGQDTIVGGAAADRLTDPDGHPGTGPLGVTFQGGGGNDTIVSSNRGRDVVDCDGGTDLVVADSAALDTLTNCEAVIRS